MAIRRRLRKQAFGFTYLEVQVSLALFMIAVSGLGPLAVIQSRQVSQIESQLDPGTTHYLLPSQDRWARKFGAVAAISSSPVAPATPPRTLIDDGGPGYSEILNGHSSWDSFNWSLAYNNDAREMHDHPGNIALWTFSGIQPGRYKVYVSYPHHNDFAEDAPYKVYDGGTLKLHQLVDQEVEATGNVFNGKGWYELGEVEIASDTLQVQLEADADDYVVADAARIVPIRNTLAVTSVSKSADTENVSAVVSIVNKVVE